MRVRLSKSQRLREHSHNTLNRVRYAMAFVGAVLLGITLVFGLIVMVLDKALLKH